MAFHVLQPNYGKTRPGSEHEAYDALLCQNKSLVLRYDYPSAAMSASGVSQPTELKSSL